MVLLIGLLACCVTSMAVFENSDKREKSTTISDGSEMAQDEEKSDISEDKYVREGDKRNLLDNAPAPSFKANKGTKTEYYDIDQRINQEYLDSVGAKLLLKEVMAYSEYSEKFENGERITSIDDDRMVWVLQVSYPNGYSTKVGVFENAVVTALYDAETGWYFGSGVKGVCREPYRR